MELYCIEEKHMNDWKEICRRWCVKNNAELLFVNNTSFGCEFPDGQMKHIYVDELASMMGADIEKFETDGYIFE